MAASVLAGVAVLLNGRAFLHAVESGVDQAGSLEEAEAVTVGN